MSFPPEREDYHALFVPHVRRREARGGASFSPEGPPRCPVEESSLYAKDAQREEALAGDLTRARAPVPAIRPTRHHAPIAVIRDVLRGGHRQRPEKHIAARVRGLRERGGRSARREHRAGDVRAFQLLVLLTGVSIGGRGRKA